MMIKSKLPKLKFAIFGFLVLLLALSPVTSVFAQGLGHGFYGTVKIGGEDAEIGTAISAQVAETEYGSWTVTTPGQYALIVQGEIEDSATINFYINGQPADQTFPFHDGWTTQLDLTVAEAEPVPEIAPTVVNNAASAVTTTSATLNGNLTGLGTASSVELSFEWGTTDAYGDTTAVVSVSQTGVFSAALSGLSPSTTYHFRAVAVGDSTGYGIDRTFTTTTLGGGGGGGGGGGAGPAPPALPPGTTDVRGIVTTAGVFTEHFTITSECACCTLDIPEGTVGLTEELEPLDEITLVPMDEPPPPPEDAHVIGLGCDFGPDGATFDPPITLTLRYDPDALPEGVAEGDLVIAMWDEEAGEWIELDCVVDTVNNTITAHVSHFTTFAVIGRVTAPPEEEEVPTVVPPVGEEEEEEEVVAPPAPAALSVSYLSVSPRRGVEPGEAVAITVLVANTGGESGSYTVVLKIDGMKEAEETVTVAAGESQDVSFSLTRDEPGTYSVAVDGLSGSFTVVAPPEGEEEEEEVPTKPGFNWPLYGGIIGGVIVAGLLIYFLVFRRRAY